METAFKFLCGVMFGCFGFMLGLLIAPIAAVAIVAYMTKISFEIGYRGDDPVKEIDKCIEEKNKAISKNIKGIEE